LGGRTVIVFGENDLYRDLQNIEFIVIERVVADRNLNIIVKIKYFLRSEKSGQGLFS
jgi:hypothetical protein